MGKYGYTKIDISDRSEAGQAVLAARALVSDAHLAGHGKDIGETHITLRYGLMDDAILQLEAFLSTQIPFQVVLGTTSSFPPSPSSDGAAVIIAPVSSAALRELNDAVAEHAAFAPADFDYSPHATIAYVQPEHAEQYVGRDVTNGARCTVHEVSVCMPDGSHVEVKLGGVGHRYSEDQPRDPDGKFASGGDVSYTASEREAIKMQLADPSVANNTLRGERPLTAAQQSHVDALDAAINKNNPLEQPLTVYRATSIQSLNGEGFASGQPDNGITVGSTFTDKGYVSTTTDKATANDPGYTHPDDRLLLTITVPAGSKVLEPSKNTVFQGAAAKLADWEHEVLLSRGSVFRIDNVVSAKELMVTLLLKEERSLRSTARFNKEQEREPDGTFTMGNVATFKNETKGTESFVTKYHGKFHVNATGMPSAIFSDKEKAIAQAKKLIDLRYSPDQPRDADGKFGSGGEATGHVAPDVKDGSGKQATWKDEHAIVWRGSPKNGDPNDFGKSQFPVTYFSWDRKAAAQYGKERPYAVDMSKERLLDINSKEAAAFVKEKDPEADEEAISEKFMFPDEEFVGALKDAGYTGMKIGTYDFALFDAAKKTATGWRFAEDQPRDDKGKWTSSGTSVDGDVKTTTYTGANHSIVVLHNTKENKITVKHLDAKGDLLVQQTHDSVGAARKELTSQGIDHKFYALRDLRYSPNQPRDPDGKFGSGGGDDHPSNEEYKEYSIYYETNHEELGVSKSASLTPGMLSIDVLVAGHHVNTEATDKLAQEIKESKTIEAIQVIQNRDDPTKYDVANGNHRVQALKSLGFATVPVVVIGAKSENRYSPDQPRDPDGKFGSGADEGDHGKWATMEKDRTTYLNGLPDGGQIGTKVEGSNTRYLLKINSDVVGHMLVGRDKSEAVVKDVDLDEKYQGKGYGSALYRHAAVDSKSHGASVLRSETSKENPAGNTEAAKRVWESLSKSYDVTTVTDDYGNVDHYRLNLNNFRSLTHGCADVGPQGEPLEFRYSDDQPRDPDGVLFGTRTKAVTPDGN